jgi:hypothetical protein
MGCCRKVFPRRREREEAAAVTMLACPRTGCAPVMFEGREGEVRFLDNADGRSDCSFC